jgi:hypothetical protein
VLPASMPRSTPSSPASKDPAMAAQRSRGEVTAAAVQVEGAAAEQGGHRDRVGGGGRHGGAVGRLLPGRRRGRGGGCEREKGDGCGWEGAVGEKGERE